MPVNIENDYQLERRLRDTSDDLQKRTTSSVFVLQAMLSAFLNRFPDFTDHSLLHSLDVLNFCNHLIGKDQVEKLSAEEIYILIMSCYLHDIGMGISDKDFKQFSEEIGTLYGLDIRRYGTSADAVRAFHNEYSGRFIRKYAQLFDIPSEDLVFAITQVARGHRKTDLYDEKTYPNMPYQGKILRLPYLAAILRLADEIDVASDRNPELLFDTSKLTHKEAIEAFGTHESILGVVVEKDSIVLKIRPKSPEYVTLINELAQKIQSTLDQCRDVCEKRSDLRLTQEKVVLQEVS